MRSEITTNDRHDRVAGSIRPSQLSLHDGNPIQLGPEERSHSLCAAAEDPFALARQD